MAGSENVNDLKSPIVKKSRSSKNRNKNYGDECCNDGTNIGSPSTAAEFLCSFDVSPILPIYCL